MPRTGLRTKLFGKPQRDRQAETVRARLGDLRDLVEKNNQVLELIAEAGEMLGGEYIFDRNTLAALARRFETATRGVVYDLNALTGDRYPQLVDALRRVDAAVQACLESRVFVPESDLVIPLSGLDEVPADAVGDKMARLAALTRLEECRIPDGFVVSSHAGNRFLEENSVNDLVEELLSGSSAESEDDVERWSRDLRRRVMDGTLPRNLRRAIHRAAATARKRGEAVSFAVRSSAIGEDGEHSFAGQYESVLGVRRRDLDAAYKEVVASLYSASVIRYRRRCGLHPTHGAMAVGCLAMVPARASGVVNTVDPERPQRGVMLVAAARGLGRAVVGGSAPADRYELSREAPHAVVSRVVATKTEMHVVADDGSIAKVPVPAAEQSAAALSDDDLALLARLALRIERFTRCAQDIEWAIDQSGQLFVVQSRPLRVAAPVRTAPEDLRAATAATPVLLSGRGEVACRGIGAGRVHVVVGSEGLDTLPQEVVLVARTSSPRLAAAVAGASAVITDIGTSTSHLAAIAREFRVPTIVDTGNATRILEDGAEVTVDAEENVVYAGRVQALLDYQLLRRSSFSDTSEFRLLRQMLKRIAPLNLQDPLSPRFQPRNCATYHDIIRFAHEKAMQEVVEGFALTPRVGSEHVRRLELGIPLDLVVVDLGGAVAEGGEPDDDQTTIRRDQVTSEPLRALIDGLTTEGAWATGPADMDLDGFMSSLTRSQAVTNQLALRPETNVAVASRDYLNLSLRLGYHFNIIDAFLSPDRAANYIYFRFAGGVTELVRRTRRATLLKRILETNDFTVDGEGDLVVGRIKKISHDAVVERLLMLGRLVAFTRQLDVLLRDDSLVERCVQNFLEGRYSVVEG